jgi:GTP-binding protein
MFVDQALITVRAGKGGDGAISFRREKAAPKGGPNGGNGGRGGSIVLVAEDGMSTLYDFRYQREWEAQPGEDGGKKQCSGGDGVDCIVRLPPGTLIFNADTSELMHDLRPGERIVIAKGGKGGWGNEHFKTSTYQTPRENTPGEPGETFNLRLELKLIADVGLVGKPNAGKSTLLKALTRANPKIGNYPFTTLSPQLGIAEIDAMRKIVFADIPGLIEGASTGAGLGLEFLRHIERTRVIVHLLDARPDDGSSPADNYTAIRAELKAYSEALADRQELIVLNKVDLIDDPAERKNVINGVARALNVREGRELMVISGATGTGLKALLQKLWSMLHPEGADRPGWTPDQATA